MKPGNLNFLEPSGPLQAFNGTALPSPFKDNPLKISDSTILFESQENCVASFFEENYRHGEGIIDEFIV